MRDLTGEPLTQTVEFLEQLGDVRGTTETIVLTQELPTVNKPSSFLTKEQTS